jgi:hypothetical protein
LAGSAPSDPQPPACLIVFAAGKIAREDLLAIGEARAVVEFFEGGDLRGGEARVGVAFLA